MILIGLGTNLCGTFGSPEELLRAAVQSLRQEGLTILAASRVWVTAPVPVSDQPWYRNAVIAVQSPLDPPELMHRLLETEKKFGRVRSVPNAPRTLDLDLLDYDGQIMDTPLLILPHPRMHARAFVLRPLAEIAPGWSHPVLKRTLSALIAALPPDQAAEPVEGATLL